MFWENILRFKRSHLLFIQMIKYHGQLFDSIVSRETGLAAPKAFRGDRAGENGLSPNPRRFSQRPHRGHIRGTIDYKVNSLFLIIKTFVFIFRCR